MEKYRKAEISKRYLAFFSSAPPPLFAVYIFVYITGIIWYILELNIADLGGRQYFLDCKNNFINTFKKMKKDFDL